MQSVIHLNMSKPSKPRVVTLGCRLNNAESDVMKTLAEQEGLENAIIVNTCAVTQEAERQARQTIRQLRKKNPGAYIIATGCAVQLRPKIFSEMPEINRVIGNGLKNDTKSFSKDFAHKTHVQPMSFFNKAAAKEGVLFHNPEKPKAFLEVQNGCNHWCSFCTIPLARGKSRSVPIETVIRQAHYLIQQGVQEIVLTGVDLTSYCDENKKGLDQLLKNLLQQLPNLNRIRLSSLDCIEMTDELLELCINEKRLLPHLHLSLQSGSDFILKLMKRRHGRHQAIELCQYLNAHRPEIALGADFIVGFPGETSAMFQDTLNLVQECGLTHLHVFPFSARPGTLASQFSDPVAASVIKERALCLRQKGCDQLTAWLSRQVGSTITLLTEKPLQGCADDFSKVHLTKSAPIHTVIKAFVDSYQMQGLQGHLIASPL